MTTTTTTNPLILSGADLQDARAVALWGVWEDAYRYRDCCMPGAGSGMSNASVDPRVTLRQTIDVAERLGVGTGTEPPMRPLRPEDVETLQRLAEYEDSLRVEIGEPEDVMAAWKARADVGRRVLALVGRLQGVLPPVHRCETCGHEVVV